MTDFRYTPRTVGAIRLHARTMAPATIATIMRCPVSTIELICRKHGIEIREVDHVVPVPLSRAELKKAGTAVEIYVDMVAFTIVAKEAKRRGTATRDLMAQLVEAVADDHMFAAVLDQ